MSLKIVCKHCEDATSDGRLFHVLAAATGNCRSPIVDSRVGGRASAEVDDERRRCRPGSPATVCRASAWKAGASPWEYTLEYTLGQSNDERTRG